MSRYKAQGLFIKYALCALLSVHSVSSMKAANSAVSSTGNSWLYGTIFFSLAAGACQALLTHRGVMNFLPRLRTPTREKRAELDEIIAQCELNPANVSIGYGSIVDNIPYAAIYSTIVIDPARCEEVEDDGIAVDARKKIAPHTQSRPISVKAQKFFLRHELGHVRSKDAYKSMILQAVALATATLCGLAAASFCFKKNSTSLILPIFAGFATWCAANFGFFLCYNTFFRFRIEKNADLFAAKYSTVEEIREAAQYFEAEDRLSLLPLLVRCLAGYPDDRTRGAYLRKIAEDKQKAAVKAVTL